LETRIISASAGVLVGFVATAHLYFDIGETFFGEVRF